MERKVLIGTVRTKRDEVMNNTQFGYAASFEDLTVPAGEYPIYAYADDLKRNKDGKIYLGWRNYIGYEGTVVASNVGGKPGEKTSYHLHVYDYMLADLFIDKHEWKSFEAEYELKPEWGIELCDFTYNGERLFCKKIYLKDGHELTFTE